MLTYFFAASEFFILSKKAFLSHHSGLHSPCSGYLGFLLSLEHARPLILWGLLKSFSSFCMNTTGVLPLHIFYGCFHLPTQVSFKAAPSHPLLLSWFYSEPLPNPVAVLDILVNEQGNSLSFWKPGWGFFSLETKIIPVNTFIEVYQ